MADVRPATPHEAAAIRRVLRLTARVRALCEKRERALAALASSVSADESLLVEVEVDGRLEVRVVRIAKPRGKYVVFGDLAIVQNRAATADERRALKQR